MELRDNCNKMKFCLGNGFELLSASTVFAVCQENQRTIFNTMCLILVTALFLKEVLINRFYLPSNLLVRRNPLLTCSSSSPELSSSHLEGMSDKTCQRKLVFEKRCLYTSSGTGNSLMLAGKMLDVQKIRKDSPESLDDFAEQHYKATKSPASV